MIYPEYFDSSLSRKRGRRVPLNISTSNPSIDMIVEVCRKLGLNPEIELDKTYPRNILSKGRVIVDKKDSKLKTLLLIAHELKKQGVKKTP